MKPRNPANYPISDGTCPPGLLKLHVWYRGQPRRIDSLDTDELRGALLDAQNDLQLVCLKLYRVSSEDPQFMRMQVEAVIDVASRHRVFTEEEDELALQKSLSP